VEVEADLGVDHLRQLRLMKSISRQVYRGGRECRRPDAGRARKGRAGPSLVSAAPEFEPFRADPATLILPMTDLHRTAAS
jgi:hypothetical protein